MDDASCQLCGNPTVEIFGIDLFSPYTTSFFFVDKNKKYVNVSLRDCPKCGSVFMDVSRDKEQNYVQV